MKEFNIKIKEVLVRTVPIKADSYESALEKVEEMYKNSLIILDADDFKCVLFK